MSEQTPEQGGLPETISPQPAPEHNQHADSWLLVMEDMRARREFGIEKYGTPLQAHDGRFHLLDVYQEELDKIVYLRQEIEARRTWHTEMQRLRARIVELEAALAEVENRVREITARIRV